MGMSAVNIKATSGFQLMRSMFIEKFSLSRQGVQNQVRGKIGAFGIIWRCICRPGNLWPLCSGTRNSISGRKKAPGSCSKGSWTPAAGRYPVPAEGDGTEWSRGRTLGRRGDSFDFIINVKIGRTGFLRKWLSFSCGIPARVLNLEHKGLAGTDGNGRYSI